MGDKSLYTEATLAMDQHIKDLMPGSVRRVGYPQSDVPNLFLRDADLLDFMKWYLSERDMDFVYSRQGFWTINVPCPPKEDILIQLLDNKVSDLKSSVQDLRDERISLLARNEELLREKRTIRMVLGGFIILHFAVVIYTGFTGT